MYLLAAPRLYQAWPRPPSPRSDPAPRPSCTIPSSTISGAAATGA